VAGAEPIRIGAVRTALNAMSRSNSALRRISLAWFLVNLAEWAYVTVLAIDGYRTHGALAVGLIGARFVPGALLGLTLLGSLTRRRPTLVLRLLSVTRCLMAAAAAGSVAAHAPLAVLVLIVWIDAVIAAPYRPVQSGVLPALAETPREL
jgi:hypothetical protein